MEERPESRRCVVLQMSGTMTTVTEQIHPKLFLLAVNCPSCGYGQAYYKEIQTRSADEPATLFFRCAKCADMWKEG